MRIIPAMAVAAIAAVLLAASAPAQAAGESLEHTKTCPPYCPRPVGPPTGGGGGAGPGPTMPPDWPRPDHPKPDHPKPRWHHPRNYYDYGYGYNFYPRYYLDPGYGSYYFEDEYYGDDYYTDDYVYRPRRAKHVSCNAARNMLRRSGYRNVRATDCRGKSYGFIAQRNGKSYKLTVSARSGAIISRKRR